ncbi:hypothetical protein ACH6EH_03985 [Paenibacillus sp. JSM ZJ436]|uniref:hypothetical protein n=1 Tax=Paenibacillus sp. JSM ZJ436 TaxID=3376190 RepID=UPI00379BA657
MNVIGIVGFVISVVSIVLNLILVKSEHRHEKLSDKAGKKWYIASTLMMGTVVFGILLIDFNAVIDPFRMMQGILAAGALYLCFNGWLEKKYIRHTRRHMISFTIAFLLTAFLAWATLAADREVLMSFRLQ